MVEVKPSLHPGGLTLVVGDAIVEALCSIRSCGSVEGLDRERAGWGGLRPVLEQHLLWKSDLKGCYLTSAHTVKFSPLEVFPLRCGSPSSWRRY